MKKRKPIVGETLYSLNVGDAARHAKQTLAPKIVKKVGSKYFTVEEGFGATQFNLFDWTEKTEYCTSQRLYESEQEWIDEKESAKLAKRIGKAFEYGHNCCDLPLPVLRDIVLLVDTYDQTEGPSHD